MFGCFAVKAANRAAGPLSGGTPPHTLRVTVPVPGPVGWASLPQAASRAADPSPAAPASRRRRLIVYVMASLPDGGGWCLPGEGQREEVLRGEAEQPRGPAGVDGDAPAGQSRPPGHPWQ